MLQFQIKGGTLKIMTLLGQKCDIAPGLPAHRMADALFTSSRVRSRHAALADTRERSQLFVVNGSRVFDVDHDVIGQLEAAAQLAKLPFRTCWAASVYCRHP